MSKKDYVDGYLDALKSVEKALIRSAKRNGDNALAIYRDISIVLHDEMVYAKSMPAGEPKFLVDLLLQGTTTIKGGE